ncbi:hypothetical protein AB0F20_10175 [Streptomyces goshikiensis]|uniref:hypothetical protein n=1 Tax=Streptomyces goshikiensis TaxID=1942 RepID=UPI0034009266
MTEPVQSPAAEPVGRIWPRWATAVDFAEGKGEVVRGELAMRLTIPPFATSVAMLLGRDAVGNPFTRVLAWPFARPQLDYPTDWWRIADAEPAQPGWPRKDGVLGIMDVAATFPLFGILPDLPAAVAFGGDENAWHQARRAALSAAVARQDAAGRWTIRVPETVTPWLTAHWAVPYPARDVPASRDLAALSIVQPSGGVLRGKKTTTVELAEVQADVAALAHVLVGVARDPRKVASAGATHLRTLLWRFTQEDGDVEEGDITMAHRQAFKWLADTQGLRQAS